MQNVIRLFQPGEGPSRGLLSDCKTCRNIREGSFEALLSTPDKKEEPDTVPRGAAPAGPPSVTAAPPRRGSVITSADI